jgi:hypothetical protein
MMQAMLTKFRQSGMTESLHSYWQWFIGLFSSKPTDNLPGYPETIGPIISLSAEQLEAMAEMELDEDDCRIVSAFYDYIGKCYMLFTRGGKCLSVPHSLLPYADLAIPQELDILNEGRGIQFGRHYKTTTAYILWLLEDEAEAKRELARGN